MATITINIPDADLSKVVEALCEGDSPTNAKAKAKVIEMVKNEVIRYWVNKAQQDNTSAVTSAIAARDVATVGARATSEAINIT